MRKEFAYRASQCNHTQMAALIDCIRALPATPAVQPTPAGPERKVYAQPGAGPFAAILDGLMRNRGFGQTELTFTGLSFSTIHGSMLTYDRLDEHRWFWCRIHQRSPGSIQHALRRA